MAGLDRFPFSTAEFKRVRAIQFGILSPDELVRVGGVRLWPCACLHARRRKACALF